MASTTAHALQPAAASTQSNYSWGCAAHLMTRGASNRRERIVNCPSSQREELSSEKGEVSRGADFIAA
eukprot:3886772-Rhodomonas_salina.2